MPAVVVIDLEYGAHHQDFRPRLAAYRLGRVPQGVVARQIAVADDPERNGQNDQDDNRPDCQRNVTPQRVEGRGVVIVVVVSHAGRRDGEDQNTTGTPSSSIRSFAVRFSFMAISTSHRGGSLRSSNDNLNVP